MSEPIRSRFSGAPWGRLVALGLCFASVGCGDDQGSVAPATMDVSSAPDAATAADARQMDTRVLVDAKPLADVPLSVPDALVVTPDTAPPEVPLEPLPECDVTPPALATARLRIDGKRFLDAAGRQVILRGVNAGGRSKFPPFLPFPFAESGFPGQEDDPPFDAALAVYLDRVVEWGHNVLRLPFTWEAVEPTRGVFDEAYLSRYRAMIDAAGERGLRVLVDFHQDLWARPYCGDGAPLWTLPEPVPPLPEFADCKQWFLSYLSDPDGVVFPAFDRFWANEDGVRDAYLDLWRHMAERTRDADAVIGYEPFNEPHPGTHDEDLWGAEILTPFFAEVAAAIRERAPDAPVYFESSGVDATDHTFTLTVPAGGRMVWAPHYYDPRVFLGLPISENFSADGPIGFLGQQGAEWNVPVLLGEFGANTTAASTALYLRKVLDAVDTHGLHSTAWQYSTAADDWNLEGFSVTGYGGVETPTAEELVRAYPAAIAGVIERFTFDRVTRTGSLSFDAAPGVTEIAAPSRLYPQGLVVKAQGAGVCGRYDATLGRILVQTDRAGPVTLEFESAPH